MTPIFRKLPNQLLQGWRCRDWLTALSIHDHQLIRVRVVAKPAAHSAPRCHESGRLRDIAVKDRRSVVRNGVNAVDRTTEHRRPDQTPNPRNAAPTGSCSR